MGRWLERLVRAQDRWAGPLGDFNHRWLSALFRPGPVKDWLNGSWLGHPLHPAVTDVPVGALLVAVVLDLLGQPAAADIALVATILFMLAAAVTAPRTMPTRTGRPASGRPSLGADGRRPAPSADLARHPRGEPDRQDVPVVLVDHRLPDRHRRGVCRRRRRVRVREHGQPSRVPRSGREMAASGHRRRGRPRDPPRGDADQGEGRGQRPRPRSHRATPSTSCTPCAPMPEGR